MTAAAQLLADLRRRGFSFAVEGDAIRIHPASRLSAELRQEISAHKQELLKVLGAADAASAENHSPPSPPEAKRAAPSAPSSPGDRAGGPALVPAAQSARQGRFGEIGSPEDSSARHQLFGLADQIDEC